MVNLGFVVLGTFKQKQKMKTFKLGFKNTSGKLDFVLIGANNEGHAIDLFMVNSSADCMISIENVTDKFVDFN